MSYRNGDWFLTRTGIQFYPLDARPEDIFIEDIAAALSMICRFGGHTTQFYSVAQHSVLVSHIVPEELQFQALMHDATEAYVGDMVRPLKRSMPEYRAAEDRLWIVICERFKIKPENEQEIKRADNIALMTERRDLLIPTDHEWSLEKDHPPLPTKIQPLSPVFAQAEFLQRFEQLEPIPF